MSKAPAPVDLEQEKLPPGAVARIGETRLTHGGQVDCLALSPDGKALASASKMDGALRVWDLATGREKGRIDNSGDKLARMVQQIVWSPDGKTLAITGQDMVLHFLDTQTLKEAHALKGQDVRGASPVFAFAPDSKVIVWWSNDGNIRLYDLEAKKEIRNWPSVRGHVPRFAFSPDGKKLAVVNSLVTTILDVGTGNEVAQHKEEAYSPYALTFSPDGKTLALGGFSDVRLWDLTAGEDKAPSNGSHHKAPIQWLAFTTDGKSLYSSSHDGEVKEWDMTVGKEKRSFTLNVAQTSANPVSAMAFSQDGKTLAWVAWSNRVRLTDLATGEELHPEGDKPLAYPFAFTPDGKQLVTPTIDGKLRLWDAANGKLVRRFEGKAGAPSFLGFSHDGKKLVSVEQSVIVWDVETGKESKRLENTLPRFGSPPALSPDGMNLAVADGDTGPRAGPLAQCNIHWWDLETGKELVSSTAGHAGRVEWLAFAPSGKTLASIGVDNTVRVWEVPTGKQLASVSFGQGHLPKLSYAADGKTLLTAHRFFDAGQTVVRVIERDPETAKERTTHDFKTPMAAAFSPDGSQLAGPAEGNTARVVDVPTGKIVAELKGHQGPVNHVAFSADGKKLATGASDGTILIWDLVRAPKP
jgi:WD40 repeat protein